MKYPAEGLTIGVLDLQGGVEEHLEHLFRIGIKGRRVRREEDFAGLSGLILPGGESTCLARLLKGFGIDAVIARHFNAGLKLWGTCAGAIILASRIKGEEPHLGLIDLEIERNSFGSQLESFAAKALIPKVAPEPIPLTFIRAPKILRVGPGVKVLLKMGEGGGAFIAAAESPEVLVTVFHPELTDSLAFHRYFARKCGLRPTEAARAEPWEVSSWTRFAKPPRQGAA